MFKAFVTICVISMPNNCVIIEDQLGPYETEARCKERELEISRKVNKYYPLWKPFKNKCQKIPVGRLKWRINYVSSINWSSK